MKSELLQVSLRRTAANSDFLPDKPAEIHRRVIICPGCSGADIRLLEFLTGRVKMQLHRFSGFAYGQPQISGGYG